MTARRRGTSPVLTDQHVFLTGGTGFVGQAILERLLSSYPETRISVLVRGKASQTAQARLDNLLRSSSAAPEARDVAPDAARRWQLLCTVTDNCRPENNWCLTDKRNRVRSWETGAADVAGRR